MSTRLIMENSDPRHLLVEVSRILKKLNIPYIITGGMAVFIWGRPRFTADIDIVVELGREKLSNLIKELKKISAASYVDEDDALQALRAHDEFNFIDGASGIKVDFWILDRRDEFNFSRLERSVKKKILDEEIDFISPEDLILIKLKWYRESESDKQLEDVRSILKISGDMLDYEYLKTWALKLGVSELLNKLTK